MAGILKVMDKFRMLVGIVKHKGPKQDMQHGPLLPIGLSRVTCDGILTIGYIDADGTIRDMFALDPGTHRVRCPSEVSVVVDCDKSTVWNVLWPSRFNPSDPTRIEAALVRPRSPKEEMADYVNQLFARTQQGMIAEALRTGNAELDISQDDYTEDLEEDYAAPLSVYQLQDMVKLMEADVRRKQEAEKAAAKPPAKPPAKPDLDTSADYVDSVEEVPLGKK